LFICGRSRKGKFQLSRSTHFARLAGGVNDGRDDVATSSPLRREDAVVLAPVNDEPCGGANAPSLTFAARAGALVERPGRGNGSVGGRTRECA
jgi:hypothetical protein